MQFVNSRGTFFYLFSLVSPGIYTKSLCHKAKNFHIKIWVCQTLSWGRKRKGDLFLLLLVRDNARRQTVRERVKNLCEMSTLAVVNAFATWRLYFIAGEQGKQKKAHRKINIHNFCGLHCVTYNFLLICMQKYKCASMLRRKGGKRGFHFYYFTWDLLSF